ncbi:MAG: phosphoribosylanthranilate isomerase [Gemmatimonadota bacterium]|nr:phosphoribosylanthranilate isomerase [Gemmatimonadota bacterium]
MTRIKICGITTLEDADAAVAAGADALGFILFEKSPRYTSPERVQDIVARLPPFVTTVGVFVNKPAEQVNAVAQNCGLHAVQLHGDETAPFCEQIEGTVIKVFRVKDAKWREAAAPYRVHAVLLDAYEPDRYGGTGKKFDWNLISHSHHRLILSGGLNPQNVQEAIRHARPYGVDTSSGVEVEPGRKDHSKIKDFVDAVKQVNLIKQ